MKQKKLAFVFLVCLCGLSACGMPEKTETEKINIGLASYNQSELAEMGLFDAMYKKPIPKYALKIGICTAKTGAAIQDIMNITKRMRSYAAGFSKNNKLVLRKNYYGYITLCETDFEWKVDEEYKISLTADGSTISVSVNDKEYLKFTDSDLPLLTGCAGISVEKGSHCLYRDIAITGRE